MGGMVRGEGEGEGCTQVLVDKKNLLSELIDTDSFAPCNGRLVANYPLQISLLKVQQRYAPRVFTIVCLCVRMLT